MIYSNVLIGAADHLCHVSAIDDTAHIDIPIQEEVDLYAGIFRLQLLAHVETCIRQRKPA